MKFFLLFHTILNFKILQAEYTSYERRKKKKKIRYKHTIGVLNFKLLSSYFSRIDIFYYLRGYYMYIY